ncbi:MAG: TIGR03960 family B12-binding radical SAM protein [Spirochaetales bacterium]|nr:TIGR03960 family B12-binding radical SAM protein [Spirochaetales bacterium]
MINKLNYQLLMSTEKPGRYTGGEFGSFQKSEAIFRIAVSYPDLYEIAMSNLAVRLLYSYLNQMDGVFCERVFAPAEDFEAILKKQHIPLGTLESNTPLHELDMIGFSFGYELTLTNMMAILEAGWIPAKRDERRAKHPIVIIGGPAATNPGPLSPFADLIYLGESEEFISEFIPKVLELKKQGAIKKDILALFEKDEAIWSPQKTARVNRGIWKGFGHYEGTNIFPVSSLRTIQNQGVVEIMRGCPNACRFCHASYFYRPFRIKGPEKLVHEVHENIINKGYREITLASLSSGDYPYIEELTEYLTDKFAKYGVSFSLPSLKINSMTLSLLEQISQVRKSGLTFAVETPAKNWQLGLNKDVDIEKIIALLMEAKEKGWRLAKFYFMIGLPIYDEDESQAIIEYIKEIYNRTGFQLNINLSTFIPKPHTPFQWAKQLLPEEAMDRIMNIKRAFQKNTKIKIGYHGPYPSLIEGLIARGDENIGQLVYEAYKKGARFDAWDDHFNKKIWLEVFEENSFDYANFMKAEKNKEWLFPWDNISLGAGKSYLWKEYEKARAGELTSMCTDPCLSPCGACHSQRKVLNKQTYDFSSIQLDLPEYDANTYHRFILSFTKEEKAIFLSHLDIMSLFERVFMRSGYFLHHTQGFNPKPIIEFANPLPLGMASADEILCFEVHNPETQSVMMQKIQENLPFGISLKEMRPLKAYVKGEKKHSLSSLYWGSDYLIHSFDDMPRLASLFKSITVLMEGLDSGLYKEACHTFFLRQDHIHIRWIMVPKKQSGIQYFLKELTDSPNDFLITRKTTLGKIGEGEIQPLFELPQ